MPHSDIASSQNPSPLSDDWANSVWSATSSGAPSLTWTLNDGNLNGTTATISGGKLVVNGNLINASANIDDGELEFAAGSSQRFTPTTNGVSNNITGTGTLTLRGAFDIVLTGANITDGNS